MEKQLENGDEIEVNGLKTKVQGIVKIGDNTMVQTEYGDFHIDLVKVPSLWRESVNKIEGFTNFGQALEAVKQGKRASRKGWNGLDMFIFQRPGDTLSIDFLQNVKSLPEAVKKYYKETHSAAFPVIFTPYLCLKAADGAIINGWLASQSDMLANDWRILD